MKKNKKKIDDGRQKDRQKDRPSDRQTDGKKRVLIEELLRLKNLWSHGPATALCNHSRTVFEDVLYSFNNASWDEDNILDQIYIKQMCSELYHDDLQFS